MDSRWHGSRQQRQGLSSQRRRCEGGRDRQGLRGEGASAHAEIAITHPEGRAAMIGDEADRPTLDPEQARHSRRQSTPGIGAGLAHERPRLPEQTSGGRNARRRARQGGQSRIRQSRRHRLGQQDQAHSRPAHQSLRIPRPGTHRCRMGTRSVVGRLSRPERPSSSGRKTISENSPTLITQCLITSTDCEPHPF